MCKSLINTLLEKTDKNMSKKTNKVILMLIGVSFILCLIIYPSISVNSASTGMKLWFNTVFPALFPFFIGVELLHKSGFVRIIGIIMEPLMRPIFRIPGCGAFTFAVGVTSGYPMGAKVTAELRRKKEVTKIEGERMLAYCNNSGPLFIVGAVGVGMFKSQSLGYILLLTHILACVTVAFIFRYYGHDTKKRMKKENILIKLHKELISKPEYNNLGELLATSIQNSLKTIISIGGYIILFSVIINILKIKIIPLIAGLFYELSFKTVEKSLISAIICGFIEITTGANLTTQAINISFIAKICSVALILGWAGLSVHAQVIGIISDTDMSIKPYLIGKAIQSILAGLYTYILVNLNKNFYIPTSSIVQNPQIKESFINGLHFNGLTYKFYLFTVAFFVICYFLVSLKQKLWSNAI